MKRGNKRDFINEIYMKRDKYLKPKENFSTLIKLIAKDKPKSNFTLLDVGCANGELLFNIQKKFKNANLTGIDVDQKVLQKAKEFCPKNIIFKKKSAASSNYASRKFDYIICCGVLSIFRDGEKILKNLKKNLNKNGRIFIFDSFNKYFFNLDIFARDYKNKKLRTFNKNVYSIQFINKFFKKNKMKTKFYPFYLQTSLKRNKKDLIYNWTEKVAGKKIVTSGLGILQYQYWIKIY